MQASPRQVNFFSDLLHMDPHWISTLVGRAHPDLSFKIRANSAGAIMKYVYPKISILKIYTGYTHKL